jgi:osmotically-inducible protein OsmY
MIINKMNLYAFALAAVLGLAVAATGCHSTDRTTGQAINDTMIAHNVNHALGGDPVIKFPDVKVNVYNGNAQLTGFVDTEQQRARAAEIAAGVPGVTQVINEITIKPTPTGRAQIRDVNPNEPPPPPPPVR